MLVAERHQYTEPYYPHVEKKGQETFTPSPKTTGKINPKRKILHFCLVLIGFAICALTVARFAMISEKQQEIADLEKILKKQESIQGHLEMELAARGELKRIEEFAKNDLEMDYPDKEQILAVKLPEKNMENNSDIPTASQRKESLWSKIVGLLD